MKSEDFTLPNMPLLFLPLILLAVLALMVLLLPLSLVQRYRVGTARRPARRWVATLNLALIALSIAIFLFGAAVTNVWVPQTLRYTVLGLAIGGALGAFGLWISRWEYTPGAVYYTPNRWLVLGITLVVTTRILYGFWRSWHAWRSGLDGGAWVVASGVAGSLGAGGIVLGYYFVYWIGLRRRLQIEGQSSMKRRQA